MTNTTMQLGAAQRRAFTLVEVLVTMGVIAILIAILLPSLSAVNESARRVVCQSNLRQIGTGILMYADDNRGFLLPSVFLSGVDGEALISGPMPQDMITLRVSGPTVTNLKPKVSPKGVIRTADSYIRARWDGIGRLYELEYAPTPKLFYCPSHRGSHRFSEYADQWSGPELDTEIVGNFHYRGEGPTMRADHDGMPIMTNNLFRIDPTQASLLSDGMREQSDFNHRSGANFFRADLTVHWYTDRSALVFNQLAKLPETATRQAVENAWMLLDASSGSTFTHTLYQSTPHNNNPTEPN